MFEIDLLDLNGYSDTLAESVSPYAIKADGLDMGTPERDYQWSETYGSPGSSILGNAPAKNVERTVPLIVRARFTSALTNVLTNPRPGPALGSWANVGTVTSIGISTVAFETVVAVVTSGNANTGMAHPFTATVAAYSAGVWVKVASGTAPIDVKFDGGTATSITATTAWQFVKTENKTLTAATRSLQILQTDTGSRTIYVKLAGVHLGATYAGFFDGACGDAAWTGNAHASTSTTLTSQDAVSRAIGIISEKSTKAVATAGTGGLTGYWLPKNASYRSKIQVRAIDTSKVDYDWSHANVQVATCDVKLTCFPYYKSPEETATISSGTKAIGVGELEATITGVKGDIPAPCRVVWTQGSNNDCRFVSYGIQGREYDSGNSLSLAATSFGTSGYSGTLTAAQTSVQTLTKSGTISGGTWALSFEGYTFSASFAHNASTATVQAAIDAAMGSGLFTVGGSALSSGNMTFTGAGTLASQYVPPLTFASSLTGGGTVTLSTTTTGYPAYVSSALYSSWSALCDTGNLTHVGNYEVWARVYDNAATTDLYKSSLRLKWSLGDLANLQQNDAVTPQAVGDYWLANLGQIHIPVAPTGTQRWTGIIEGKTSGSAGNTLRIVQLRFKPIGTGSGEVRSIEGAAASLVLSDAFNQTAGSYTGKTMDLGGTVSGGGDADDFTLDTTNHWIQRTATGDTALAGRYVYAGNAVTDCRVSSAINPITLSGSGGIYRRGVLFRYVDASNYAFAFTEADVSVSPYVYTLKIYKVIATVKTMVTSTVVSGSTAVGAALTAIARSNGDVSVSREAFSASANDTAFATGGALASGKMGIYDEVTGGTSGGTRSFDNFSAYTLPAPAVAIYAGRSLEFRTDGVLRETSAGGVYGSPAIASQPFQPELTPAGAEGLTNRILVQTSRFNPDIGPDPLGDPGSLAVYYEPTWAFARSGS